MRSGTWVAPLLLPVIAVALAVTPARAGVIYTVQVNTTSVNTTTGWLDIQFNPGVVSWQNASADVSVFTSDGTLLTSATPLSPEITGNVTGSLPSTLTLQNTTAFNDYFQRMVFGTFLDFKVTLYGDAIDSPNNSVFSGSSFSFALYADDESTPVVGGPPLFEIDINAGSGVTTTDNSPGVVKVQPDTSSVPEPGGVAGFSGLIAILMLPARRLLQKRRA